ncbi:ATP-binding protein [Magnetospirillum sp. XM-1]|uniref:sensor histidine kinase n=1 Tax=Magnetospirillum sp. XM-1 TaxID=1663591 RepID=UPI0012E3AB8E|nr:ATP-binding protein [Magnetospirillum sp. XM-1]
MGLLLIVLGLMFQGGWRPGEIYAPSRQWAPSAILSGLGMVLISLRGYWHPLLSIILANALLLGSVCLLHRGVAVHVGRPPADRWYGLSLAALIPSFLWFTFHQPDVQIRIAILSLIMAPFLGHCALLLRHGPPSFTNRLFRWVLGFITLWFAVRAAAGGLGVAVGESYLREGGLTAVNVFISSISAVVMVAVQYRLEAERVGAALAAEAESLRRDRDRLEETVAERTAELSRSNAELEQFAYVASHDLRQPLRMVSSYISLVERRLGGALDGDLRDFIHFAVDGARRMDAMIVGLLDYSRIGRGERAFAPVDLARAVQEALSNLEPAISSSGAVVEVQPGLPKVQGDAMELLRLFQNLVGNALKYVVPGSVPHVRIACADLGNFWQVTVEDNGIGVPSDSAERIFGVFQRAVEREAYDGCGIGLAICRKIAEGHGGSITVEAGADGGSLFQVRLPKDLTGGG